LCGEHAGEARVASLKAMMGVNFEAVMEARMLDEVRMHAGYKLMLIVVVVQVACGW
jgi:hypothetical protein